MFVKVYSMESCYCPLHKDNRSAMAENLGTAMCALTKRKQLYHQTSGSCAARKRVRPRGLCPDRQTGYEAQDVFRDS